MFQSMIGLLVTTDAITLLSKQHKIPLGLMDQPLLIPRTMNSQKKEMVEQEMTPVSQPANHGLRFRVANLVLVL